MTTFDNSKANISKYKTALQTLLLCESPLKLVRFYPTEKNNIYSIYSDKSYFK